MRNTLTYGTTITNMSDMLRRLYEELAIAQERVRKLESECEALNERKAGIVAEYAIASALLSEKEETLKAAHTETANIQRDIDSVRNHLTPL